jgi:SAM-dependent methyltransferase
MIAANAGPAPVIDYVGAMGLQAFFVGLRVGLFDQLAAGPCAPAELAELLGTDERGTELLLAALESCGYVSRRGGDYRLTRMAAKWSPRLGGGVEFYERMATAEWDDVTRRLRGQVVAPPDGDGGLARHDEEDDADIQRGMLANARLIADELSWRVRLPRSAGRLIDVGGGHGLYSVRFCQRRPRLLATIVDRGAALEVARAVAADEGVSDRITLQNADFWADDLGQGYDVALAFNLLNAYDDDRKVELLRRIREALARGGVLVVADGMRGQARRGLARAIVELGTLRLFEPGRPATYRPDELAACLRRAGFRARRTGALRSMPWMGFTTAVRDDRRARPPSLRAH